MHSAWAAADVFAGGAERHAGGADRGGAVPGPQSANTRGWQSGAYDGNHSSTAAGLSLGGAEADDGTAQYALQWGGTRADEPAPATWQPPPEDGGGAAPQHNDGAAAAGWAVPYDSMLGSGGGYGTGPSTGGYGGSPLELSPPSVIEPAAGFGMDGGAAADEWQQPGKGSGVSSVAVVEDEMVDLDF